MEATQQGASTVHEAAQKLTSLMDDTPPEETTEDGNPSQEVEAEETEATEVEEEAETEETVEATEEPESTEEESEQVTNFNELADHLGVEEDFLNSLKVPTKINGVEQDATIKELVQNFQKSSAADVGLQELAEERKQFSSQVDEAKSTLESEWSRIQALNTDLQSMLGEDEDLSDLRETDPAEYAARVTERQEKLAKAAELQQKIQKERTTKVMDDYNQRLATEQQSLLSAIPEWTDSSVAKTENAKLRTYLKSQGLKDYEIDGKVENGTIVHTGIIDHRAIVLARKAMMFDESQTATRPKKEKLKTLPKVGAGKPKSRNEAKHDVFKKQRKKLKDSGKVQDAALLIRNQLFGD